jgi:hypothetical protein
MSRFRAFVLPAVSLWLAVASSQAAPVASMDVSCMGTKIGELRVDTYATYMDATRAGATMVATFDRNATPNPCWCDEFRWVQFVITDDHPLSDQAGMVLAVPYTDPPIGGYQGNTGEDAKPYYWTDAEATAKRTAVQGVAMPDKMGDIRISDVPKNPKTSAGDVKFETDLVCVYKGKMFGILKSFQWGFNIDGAGTPTLKPAAIAFAQTANIATALTNSGFTGWSNLPQANLVHMPVDAATKRKADRCDRMIETARDTMVKRVLRALTLCSKRLRAVERSVQNGEDVAPPDPAGSRCSADKKLGVKIFEAFDKAATRIRTTCESIESVIFDPGGPDLLGISEINAELDAAVAQGGDPSIIASIAGPNLAIDNLDELIAYVLRDALCLTGLLGGQFPTSLSVLGPNLVCLGGTRDRQTCQVETSICDATGSACEAGFESVCTDEGGTCQDLSATIGCPGGECVSLFFPSPICFVLSEVRRSIFDVVQGAAEPDCKRCEE